MSIPDSFNQLYDLSVKQANITNTLLKKVWQYVITLLWRSNSFENYVLTSEPNDSGLISKYSKVSRIDLSGQSSVSVDELYLHTIHVDHPLTSFTKNDHNSVDISKDLEESPILVFIHGLGGQMAQFDPLMALLAQCSEILTLDLPGFGDSRVKPDHYARLSNISPEDIHNIGTSVSAMKLQDFTSDNIATIITEFITQSIPDGKKVVLIGHSMGTHLCVRVAKKLPISKVEGFILLSNPGFEDDVSDLTPETKPKATSKLNLPRVLFSNSTVVNLFRTWDRLEGLDSHSVKRQVGDLTALPANTSLYVKLKQFRWNLDIDTAFLLKYVKGFKKCKYSDLVEAIKRFNDNPFDQRVYEKTVLVGGTKDAVTPLEQIAATNETLSKVFQRNVSTFIEVKNAGHSLLLGKPEFISGKILNHIEKKFPERLHLSPAWVLRVKADVSGDKWGLKNELKWSKLAPVSWNISRQKDGKEDISPLLGMKTLREGDSKHSPLILENLFMGRKDEKGATLLIGSDSDGLTGSSGGSLDGLIGSSGSSDGLIESENLPEPVDTALKASIDGTALTGSIDAETSTTATQKIHGNLIAVVDISADIPPYNPETFTRVKYYKCSTVSKVVPDPASVRKFITLIDKILKANEVSDPLIAVHCHYGFNRTGFLICCYLIERLGWTVEEAIEGFRLAKAPGIKHRHFIDALYVRYES